ncbi:hypothetical protein [Hymenobacter properus]|uniref:Uncharacterized protein n=1 Tax=Hymenobacter properus TaxID=2791026 RepID=A0A931BF48_9BACT|nr:hypothetical protein [Hymenobacter properus]MBF9140531.1 hypothetical protein [Hymenobacter properus]MBR7719338.1 hypothetical protein [Microvirga sp. SRT04]
MEKLFSTILYGIAVISCVSCKKEEVEEPACSDHCTTIVGRFTTDNRATPLAGLPVRMQWVRWKGAFSTDVRTKAKTVTDAQGNYRLNFYVKEDELKDGYFEVCYSGDASKYILDRDQTGASWLGLSRDTVIVSDWLLPRKAFVHPEITNAAQIVGDYWGEYGFANGAYRGRGRFTYAVVFTFNQLPSGNIEVAANQPVDLKSFKTVNGQLVVAHDTVRLAPGATYVHRVTY